MRWMIGLSVILSASAAIADVSGLEAGVALYHQGEFEGSIRSIETALPDVPERAGRGRGHLFVGLSQAVLGKWVEARASFLAALTDDPDVVIDRERVRPAIVAAFDEVRSGLRGQLEVVSSTHAVVLVDGELAGATPLVGAYPVGRHRVVVRTQDESREYVKDDVVFRVDEPVRIVAILAPRFGRIELWSTPQGADVWLGARMVGRTPLVDFAMPAGAVSLDVRMPGYANERVEAIVPAEAPVRLDVVLRLDPRSQAEAAELPESPLYGPDLRDGVDRWTLDMGVHVGGAAPLSASVQTADPERLGISGGMDFAFELGASAFDLVQVGLVLGVLSFGPDVDLYAERLTEPGASTSFVFNPGSSGDMSMRLLRAGLEARVTLLRFGSLRTFAGLGVYAMTPLGSVSTTMLPTDGQSDDGYTVDVRLGGTSVAPLLGGKWTIYEHSRPRSYWALDLLVEGRLDVMSWDKPEVFLRSRTMTGRDRGLPVGLRWEQAISASGSSVAVGMAIAIAARL